jgi:hypothetical protein
LTVGSAAEDDAASANTATADRMRDMGVSGK